MLARIELSAPIAKSWRQNSLLKRVELPQAHLNRYLTMKVPKNLAWVLTAQAPTCLFVETITLVDRAHGNQNGQLAWRSHQKLQLNITSTRAIVVRVRRLRNPTRFIKCLHRRQTKWHPSMRPNGNLRDECLTISNQTNQVTWKTSHLLRRMENCQREQAMMQDKARQRRTKAATWRNRTFTRRSVNANRSFKKRLPKITTAKLERRDWLTLWMSLKRTTPTSSPKSIKILLQPETCHLRLVQTKLRLLGLWLSCHHIFRRSCKCAPQRIRLHQWLDKQLFCLRIT